MRFNFLLSTNLKKNIRLSSWSFTVLDPFSSDLSISNNFHVSVKIFQNCSCFIFYPGNATGLKKNCGMSSTELITRKAKTIHNLITWKITWKIARVFTRLALMMKPCLWQSNTAKRALVKKFRPPWYLQIPSHWITSILNVEIALYCDGY